MIYLIVYMKTIKILIIIFLFSLNAHSNETVHFEKNGNNFSFTPKNNGNWKAFCLVGKRGKKIPLDIMKHDDHYMGTVTSDCNKIILKNKKQELHF